MPRNAAREPAREPVRGSAPPAAGPVSSAVDPAEREVEVSVVMPCLNEAEGVGLCVRKALAALDELGLSGEVVVADNGSTDGSREIAEAAGARVVHESRRGYGSAYLRGFEAARGRLLVMGDADNTYDFSDLERFVAPLQREEADFVIGSRFRGEILPGAMPWSHRWIGNPILSGMLRLLFKTSVSDAHCGMRSFTRDAYRRMQLRTTGMEFASEMVVNSLRSGLAIHEVPITYHPREGDSKLQGLRDAWRHVRFMLLFSPSYLFQLPALALMLVGGLVVALLAGGPVGFFGRTWDHHTFLFGALAVAFGYNLMLFHVFAKTFSVGAGFARPDRWLSAVLRLFSLERGLIAGGLLFLAGLGLELKIVADWWFAGRGELAAVRGVVAGMLALLVGAQTVFASFLISLLLLKRRGS